MADFTIVRTNQAPLSDVELGPVRRFLFGLLDGLASDDKRAWRRLWKKIRNMQPGEMLTVEFIFSRHGPSHRGYMKMEAALFDAQERIDDREQFRDWLKVGAKWVTWLPGPTGGIVPIPKSISYAKADEEDFHRYVVGALAFIRTAHFGKWLWPHLDEARRLEMVEVILDQYEKFLRRFDQ